MNTPKISIVIPVYNVEKYLAECLDSCINQTLHDIEIICVNDCSPDNSQAILEEYAAKDGRIKIFVHEKNTRQGGARNTGIENASGEYVWFVDSDDFIDLNACQLLYDTAKQYDLDVLCFNAISFRNETDGSKHYVEDIYYTDWAKNTIINPNVDFNLTKERWTVSPCCFISKTIFTKQFRFREHCFFEDTDWTSIVFASALRLRCIVFTAYHRRYVVGSTTQSTMTEKKFCDRIAVVKSLQKFIKENKINKKCFLYHFYCDYHYWLVYDLKQCNYSNDIIQSFLSESKKFIRAYNRNGFFQKVSRWLFHPISSIEKRIKR